MRELSKDNLLRSWKDIAAYLGVDVRTCHRWEARHGMPVHRAEGAGKRSNVFAYKDELDAWFRGTFRNHGHLEAGEEVVSARPRLKWALPAAGVALLAGAIFLSGWFRPKGRPADFAIDGSSLVILDQAKRELWRYDTGMEDLRDEAFYREHFQVKSQGSGNVLPLVMIKDLDGDGRREVLFAPKRVPNQTGEGRLHCFDDKGNERWPPFRAGKELRCGGKAYSHDYRISGFHAHDLDGDGRREIVVEAVHSPDWPCQLALLDCSGNLLGDYLNAGYLNDFEYCDIDGDGREELIVVGVNNEYRGGCLIVFDPREIRGRSPQSGDFACDGLEPGSELFYITVPRTDLAQAAGSYLDDLVLLDISESGIIRATSGFGLIYGFDFDLRALPLTVGHGFRTRHEELAAEGKLSSVLGPDYERAVLEAIRWWTGSAWSAEPAKVQR
jgi:hypothetical protein